MEFNPEGMSDRELLTFISAVIRNPQLKRKVVAHLEQLMMSCGELVEPYLQGPKGPAGEARASLRLAADLPSPDETAGPAVYRFRLVKREGAWVQDDSSIHLLLPPEVVDYITVELAHTKKIANRTAVIAGDRGFRSYVISAKRVSKKELSGIVEELNKSAGAVETPGTPGGMENNLMYINMDHPVNITDSEKVFYMIDRINTDPDLRKSLLDYFYLVLKPLYDNRTGEGDIKGKGL